MPKSGVLYIVSTPIGNLGDITYRAVDVLKAVSIIASEDTRETRKLLGRYDIHTPLISYFEHNEIKRSGEIIKMIGEGKDVALVSRAGTPSISDPGYRLTKKAVESGIKTVTVPGPAAVTAALAVSGLPTDRFLFIGFLPDKQGKRIKKLEEIAAESATLVFYVSKWKIQKVLDDMVQVLGDRRASFCRELTKLHEEVRYTTLKDLCDSLKNQNIKGEITIVVEGA